MTENGPRNVLLGDTRGLYHHGCEAVIAELLRGLEGVGVQIDATVPDLDWQQTPGTCLDANLVIVNGEGSLHSDRTVVEELVQLAEHRNERGLKTILVNTSWFGNSRASTERLSAFTLVAARDSRSAQAMEASGKPIIWAPDLALRYADRLALRPKGTGISVGDSTDTRLAVALRKLGERRGWSHVPILFPAEEYKPGTKAAKLRRRYRWAKTLGPLGRLMLSERYRSHLVGKPHAASYAEALSASRGIVTGRYHSVCFAIGLGLPFLAVRSNTPKIEVLLEDAGLDTKRRMIDPHALAGVTDVPGFSAGEREHLEAFRIAARERWTALFSAIAEAAD